MRIKVRKYISCVFSSLNYIKVDLRTLEIVCPDECAAYARQTEDSPLAQHSVPYSSEV